MNLIDFTYLAKFFYVSLGVLERFTIEDRKHTHYMRIILKFVPLLRGA